MPPKYRRAPSPYDQAPLSLHTPGLRLMQLLPTGSHEPLSCRLRSYPMRGCPQYTALSYRWIPIPTEPSETVMNSTVMIKICVPSQIVINGVSVSVGPNLHNFLSTMCAQARHGLFWIDAICINQTDVKERNHQVQMMREIYSNAHNVAIWLGDSDARSYLAMTFLKGRKSFGRGVSSGRKVWSKEQAKAVIAICETDYWRRMWIIQEVVLAKQATIIFGRQEVDWQAFQALFADAQALIDYNGARGVPHIFDFLATPAAIIAKTKTCWDGTPQPLTTLLWTFHGYEATETRDKIFALHGLAAEAVNISIDYHKDPRELFLQIMDCTALVHEKLYRLIADILETLYPLKEVQERVRLRLLSCFSLADLEHFVNRQYGGFHIGWMPHFSKDATREEKKVCEAWWTSLLQSGLTYELSGIEGEWHSREEARVSASEEGDLI